MWFNSKKTQEKQPDYNIYEDNYVSPSQVVETQDAQAQVVQSQPAQQPQSGFVPASNGLNF